MKNIKIKDLNELKGVFEEFGYFPNEEILTEAFLGLRKFGSNKSIGQDIWAMCLDGPAGAGKSSFTETYRNVASYYFDEEVEFIDYECNDTTGKSELYEEVGMVAVVLKDEEKIIIPGAVVRAIEKVNEGKKVILLLDEFDKSRTETDVFFYKFLQSGKINTTQQGDLEIKPEYKSNLQVFFCKNDFRELSGPLSRRTRNLMLDYMEPSLFYDIAINKLTGKCLDESHIISLINLVVLIYEFAYQNKEKFDRIPAPSEMLIAIEDAFDLSISLNVSGSKLYSLLFKRLFKSVDNYSVFESLLANCNEKEYADIKKFLLDLKTSEEVITKKSLMDKMASDILNSVMENKTKELDEKIKKYDEMIEKKEKELENLEQENAKKLAEIMESKTQDLEEAKKEIERQKNILFEERMKLRQGISLEDKDDVSSIKLTGGNLVLNHGLENIVTNFNDSTEFVRRGQSVFDVNKNANWTLVASMNLGNIDYYNFIKKMVNSASAVGFNVYENGISLNSDAINLIMVCENNNGNYSYNFLASTQIIPSKYIDAIKIYFKFFLKNLGKSDSDVDININSLIYNDEILDLDSVILNVYKITRDFDSFDEMERYLSEYNFKCDDKSKVLEKCIELMDSHSKKLEKFNN